ncbi:MAG: TatD family hydrolase [Longimicrobiales bacterium]
MFDSHCHLTSDQLAAESDAVLERARTAGVSGVVTIASDLDDAGAAATLAGRHPDVWCSAGVHPHGAALAGGDWTDRLRALLAHPRCVAIGETGLDYYYDNAPRAVQRAVFEQQLEIAAELALPVVVHARQADDDTLAMVRAATGVRGVLHCFDGGGALLDGALTAGWYISFSGLVTFKRYEGAALVAGVPDDRLLIETDSPYLAPVPHRGRRNEPAYVANVAAAVAAFRGQSMESVGAQTEVNARAFYGIAS